MKEMRSLINSLVVSGVALAMVSTLAAQTPVQGSATVVRMKGDARYMVGNSGWKPLKFGDVLKPGTVIQTEQANHAYVDLVLGDVDAVATPVAFNPSVPARNPSFMPVVEQNVVRISENTILGIDKLTSLETGADVVTETQLDLKAGHIFGSVKKMSRASKYEIKLPNGVAGIRGTLYELWADGSSKVRAGSLVIVPVNPATGDTMPPVVLNGDQGYDAPTGKISDLGDSDKRLFDNWAQNIKVSQRVVPPGTTVDHTVQYVSPTKGKGKHKGQQNY